MLCVAIPTGTAVRVAILRHFRPIGHVLCDSHMSLWRKVACSRRGDSFWLQAPVDAGAEELAEKLAAAL